MSACASSFFTLPPSLFPKKSPSGLPDRSAVRFLASRAIPVMLLGVLSPLGASCIPDLRPQLAELRTTVDKQRREIEQLRVEVNDGLTLALCSPELRQLLENVTKECTPAADSREPAQCTTR